MTQISERWSGVCADARVASCLVAQGTAVVLCGTEAALVADTLIALRGAGGRVAAMIGDLTDPDVETAALTMAAELFGGEAVVVRTLSDAGQLAPDEPGLEGAGSGTV